MGNEKAGQELKREIGAFGGFNILTGIMVGSGIFYLGSYVLERSGMSQSLALIIWVIGGAITLLSGLCYAELGAMMPETGGTYIYLRRAYGKLIAFMSGATGYLLASCGSIAALALAAANIFGTFITLTELQIKLIAVIIILLLSVINYFGVKQGSIVQNIFTIAKLIPIILIIVLGLAKGRQPIDFQVVPSGISFVSFVQMVSFAVLATFWAYEGWTNLNIIAGEMKHPKRNIPLAIISAIVVTTILYVLFNLSIYRVLSFSAITESLANGNFYLGTATAYQLLGEVGKWIVTITMIIAIVGATNGCVLVFPRKLYSMSNDGTFFSYFGKVHPKYNTPSTAIYLTTFISIVLVFSRDLDQLTTLVTFSALIFNVLIFAAIYIFRRTMPNLERPYKVWGYPITPAIAIAVMLAMIVNTFAVDPQTSIMGTIVTVASIGLYYLFEYAKKKGIE